MKREHWKRVYMLKCTLILLKYLVWNKTKIFPLGVLEIIVIKLSSIHEILHEEIFAEFQMRRVAYEYILCM